MTATKKLNLVSVADYLASELDSPVKREYLGGVIYTRAEERNQHHRIASNVLGVLGFRVRGRCCQTFNSDTKIRIQLPGEVRFYYPEAMVVSPPNPAHEYFQDHPVVIAEVLSPKTRRIDEGEKKDAYLTIPSLCVYLLIETELPAAVAFRRTEHGFVREVYEGLDAVIPLGEIDTVLPLAEIYESVEFMPEPADEEDA